MKNKLIYLIIIILITSLFSCSEPPSKEEFLKTVKENDVTSFQELYKRDKSVIEDIELISYAIMIGSNDILAFLLSKEMDPDIYDDSQDTALHAAVKHNNFEAAKILIEGGSSLTFGNVDDYTALHIAVINGNMDMVKFLRDINPDLDNEESHNVDIPFYLAVMEGQSEIVRYYIEEGVDVNTVGLDESTPLAHALIKKDAELTKYLIDKGASVNYIYPSGSYPLIYAIQESDIYNIQFLLANGAELLPEGAEKKYLINAIVKADSYEIAKLLLNDFDKDSELINECYRLTKHLDKAGVYSFFVEKKELLTGNLDYLIHSILFVEDTNIFRYFLDNGYDPDYILDFGNNDKTSALLYVSGWMYEIGEALIEYGADVNNRNERGETPLMRASWRGHLPFVQMLLENGAKINLTSQSGATALYNAILTDNYEVIKYLLENGADPDIANDTGKKAIDWADDDKTRELLLKYMK